MSSAGERPTPRTAAAYVEGRYLRYMTDPLYKTMVDTICEITILAIEEADREWEDADIQQLYPQWQWRRKRVTKVLIEEPRFS